MALANIADWAGKRSAAAYGSACGASGKPGEKPSACGAGDKPEKKPSACGVGDK